MVGDSEGRDEFAGGAVSPRFRFQGMAAGLRAAEVSAQLVALPPEPPVTSPATDAISWTRWIPGVLLTAFVSGVGVWLMLLPSTDPGVAAAEPAVSVQVAASSAPSGTVPVAPPPVIASASVVPSANSPGPSAPSTPVASLGVTPEGSDHRPRRSTRPRTRVAPPPSPVKPIVSLLSASSTGSLNSVDIRVAIDPLRSGFRGCVAGELERGKDVRQTIVVKMAVRGPDVDPPVPQTTMKSPRLWGCIRNVLTSAKFRGHQGYAEVMLSLRLGPPL
jgi:hypothetical protein